MATSWQARVLCGTIAAFLTANTAVEAQWLKYPTAGVPRNPDGTPNLAAPTPRLGDGKPDFSGLWGMMCPRPLSAPGAPRPPADRTPSASEQILCAPDVSIPRQSMNIGTGMDGGTLPYQPWASQLVASRREQNGKDDPTTHCLPGGVPRIHISSMLRKVLHSPALLVFLSERNASYRQVFLDGRPLPDDPTPAWNGYSTGHWEGDELVIKTNGIQERNWLDRSGSPITASATITERIRRPNYGNLEIDITVDDPMAYTRAWTVSVKQSIVLDTELLDYICLENEKSIAHMVGK